MVEIVCDKCGEKKPEAQFRVGGASFAGKVWRSHICNGCKQKKRKADKGTWSPDKLRAYYDKRRASRKKHKLQNPELTILQRAKHRAQKEGNFFNIDISDIIIPTTCPILGIPLTKVSSETTLSNNSPSLDRVDNTKGYVKGNVAVISQLANSRKRDMTLKQIENMYLYTKKYANQEIKG